MTGIRLDKWLWAARFFKTRRLARDAIVGGKIHINGVKAKPSKEVIPGLIIKISRGQIDLTIQVIKLSENRRPAKEAVLLYLETQESITNRTIDGDNRKYAHEGFKPSHQRPNKRERRQLSRLKGIFE